MSAHPPPLEFDPELAQVLPELPIPKLLTVDMLPALRAGTAKTANAVSVIAGRSISHRELDISTTHGPITLSIFENTLSSTKENRPGILYVHGGGRILGNRFSGVSTALEWVVKLDAVCVSVEYHLAPEHPGMVAVEECYAALRWIEQNAENLGIDRSKLMIAGQSTGGGLAAGVALLVRDKGGPKLCAQLLMCPQLDDRNNTISARQFHDRGIWNAKDNALGWRCALGDNSDFETVSPYLAPARETDLRGLPPAYIDVGSAEVFRDEDVLYAMKLWECDVQAELHVWPGGYHAFDMLVPMSDLARKAISTRSEWVGKVFACM